MAIKKYLPKFVQDLGRRIYTKWANGVTLNKKLVRDLVEFYNLNNDFKISYQEAIMLCRLGQRLMADLWNILNPGAKEEIKNFYRVVPYSLFELVAAHGYKPLKGFRKEVIKYSFGNVLDYGGGIGLDSMKLAKRGLSVTYVDVEGVTMQFAKWLFQKYRYNIEVLDAEKDQEKIWGEVYDTILCIEVIEHIPQPQVLLEKVAKSLRKNGRLIITQLDCPGATPIFPFHLKVNTKVAEELLNFHGLFKANYNWLWIKET